MANFMAVAQRELTVAELGSTFDQVFSSANDVCEWLKENEFEEDVIEAFKGDHAHFY